VPPKDFPYLAGDRDQEWWAQQASFGLMQLMGGLARELGFKGAYLTALCDPDLNLQIGCKHLSALLKWADGDVTKALGAYNRREGWLGFGGGQDLRSQGDATGSWHAMIDGYPAVP
jgi:hypothetical protein